MKLGGNYTRTFEARQALDPNWQKTVKVGTNRQPHHAASIGKRGDMLAQRFFDATGVDIRILALNLVQPPLSPAGQDALRRDGIAPSSHTATRASGGRLTSSHHATSYLDITETGGAVVKAVGG